MDTEERKEFHITSVSALCCHISYVPNPSPHMLVSPLLPPFPALSLSCPVLTHDLSQPTRALHSPRTALPCHSQDSKSACSGPDGTELTLISTYLHLFQTKYGQCAGNSVKMQPISTDRAPNHARTAAEMSNRRNCLHYFPTACTAV